VGHQLHHASCGRCDAKQPIAPPAPLSSTLISSRESVWLLLSHMQQPSPGPSTPVNPQHLSADQSKPRPDDCKLPCPCEESDRASSYCPQMFTLNDLQKISVRMPLHDPQLPNSNLSLTTKLLSILQSSVMQGRPLNVDLLLWSNCCPLKLADVSRWKRDYHSFTPLMPKNAKFASTVK
jgi:hypothetical protein